MSCTHPEEPEDFDDDYEEESEDDCCGWFESLLAMTRTLTTTAYVACVASTKGNEVTAQENVNFAVWPRDAANGRLLCAPEHPMPKGAPGQWAHTNVVGTGGSSDFHLGQEFDDRRCKDCGASWSEEVAQ